MNKELKTSLLRLLFGIISCFIVINCTWAAGVPKYNPNDPNPKPGLYRVGDMNYAGFSRGIVPLNDGRVLLFGAYGKFIGDEIGKAEIFDPNTGKFKKLPDTIYKHYCHQAVLLDDGNVFMVGTKNMGTYNVKYFEIFNSKENKFYDLKLPPIKHSKGMASFQIYKLQNGNVAIYPQQDNKKIYSNDLYIYNPVKNTISPPIKKSDKGYINEKILEYMYFEKYRVPKSVEKTISANISRLYLSYQMNNNKYLIYAPEELDYGISTKTIENGKDSYDTSWFHPIYEFNLDDNRLIKMNEYFRSVGRIEKLKNKNMFLITGGLVPAYVKNPNDDPKNIPLKDRLNLGVALEDVKHAYLYIYK